MIRRFGDVKFIGGLDEGEENTKWDEVGPPTWIKSRHLTPSLTHVQQSINIECRMRGDFFWKIKREKQNIVFFPGKYSGTFQTTSVEIYGIVIVTHLDTMVT